MPQLGKGFSLGVLALAMILASVGWGFAGEMQWIGAPMDQTHAMAYDHGRNILFLGTHQGLSRSEDGAKTWQKVETPVASHVVSFAHHPENPALLFAATGEGEILKSTDGGAHWTQQR
jgi:hypothetical protein